PRSDRNGRTGRVSQRREHPPSFDDVAGQPMVSRGVLCAEGGEPPGHGQYQGRSLDRDVALFEWIAGEVVQLPARRVDQLESVVLQRADGAPAEVLRIERFRIRFACVVSA